MASDDSFLDLIRRVRAGDKPAAEALFKRYGDVFNIIIRVQIDNNSLRRLVDTADIRQAVFLSLLRGLKKGRYIFSDDDDLVNLLFKMAVYKLSKVIRKERRIQGGIELSEVADPAPSPSTNASIHELRELLERAKQLFTVEERRILELYANGASWAAIAEDLGGTSEARRKQWKRAVERVREEMEFGGEE
jgi:RNA polymerase sigma factor (sigma-70 family)